MSDAWRLASGIWNLAFDARWLTSDT